MKYVLITGSSGLVGSESSIFFHNKNFKVLGIDNDSRSYFFGSSASTKKTAHKLKSNLKNYQHFNIDIRNKKSLANPTSKNFQTSCTHIFIFTIVNFLWYFKYSILSGFTKSLCNI